MRIKLYIVLKCLYLGRMGGRKEGEEEGGEG